MMNKDIEFVGISNAPSDYSAQDGVMSHLVNLIPEEGELKVVGKGECLWNVTDKYQLLFVHSVTSESEHYIFFKDNTLYYQMSPTTEDGDSGFKEIGDVAGLPKIVSVGNTLIAYSENEMRYFLWKEDKNSGIFVYKNLGTHLPEPNLRFGLQESTYIKGWSLDESKSLPNKLTFKTKWNTAQNLDWMKEENQRDLEQQLCVIANMIIANNTKYGQFIFPFFVRYAYRLYDGTTLTMHSAPILMTPSTFEPMYLIAPKLDVGLSETEINISCTPCRLLCNTLSDVSALEDFSDIIKSVDIFISAPIYTYKQSGYDKIDDEHCHKAKYKTSDTRINYGIFSPDTSGFRIHYNTFPLSDTWYFTLPKFTNDDIKKDVENKSLFYLLKSIPISELKEYTAMREIDIQDSYLSSLVNKEVMTDDYNSHESLLPKQAFVYNSRLNISNISRKFFGGWNPSAAQRYDGSVQYSFSVWYELHNSSGQFIVAPENDGLYPENIGLYGFYPNTFATKMIAKRIKNGVSATPNEPVYMQVEMKQHDFLNGAFYVFPFWEEKCNWDKTDKFWETAATGTDPVTTDKMFKEPNKVYTSAVNMPFHFPVAGINTVGFGEIIGLSSTTQALSEGQFGQYPLYAFTDEGIWALQTNENGGIASVTPVTRDVVNNADSITQIDDAILFSSNRGLMVLQGSQTQCLSEALDGEWFSPTALPGFAKLLAPDRISFESFKGFLSGSRIAYDYVRQRILICNPGNVFAPTYSLRSKQWGEVRTGKVVAIANSYPNSVVQVSVPSKIMESTRSDIIDLSQENGDDVVVAAVSRPITFGDGDALKTVNTMIARGDKIKTALYGTMDYKRWTPVASSVERYITGIQGTPYKAFRLVLVGTMSPGQRLTKASFEITPKDDGRIK